ncbi:MAG TPA: MMPL family transporter [Myxococcota bacterium]|nr:MMPL family transporter [Myxococcota bacterium]
MILATALLATQLRHLRFYLDPDRTLPPEHPLVILGNRITEVFGGKNVVVVGLEVRDGTIYDQATLNRVKRITDRARDIPGVIPSNILSLSAVNVKDITGTEDGMQIRRVMAEVPGDEQGITALRERVRSNDLVHGLLVSADEKMTLVIIDFSSTEKPGGFAGIHRRVSEIIEPEQDTNTAIHLAGLPIQLHQMEVYSERMKYVFPLALLVIALLLYGVFRTVQGMIIPLLTAILSVVWGLGIMGLIGWALDPFNVMTPILILAIGAGHSVQILKRYYEEFHRLRDNRAAVIESTSRIGLAMLTAGIVAATGFASLITFRVPTFSAFGMLTASGILSALVIEMTFIPAIRALLRAPDEAHLGKEQRTRIFDPFLSALAGWINGGKSKYIVGVFVAVVALALAGISQLVIENGLSTFFAGSSRVMQDMEAINAEGAGAFVVQVLVEGKGEDALKDPQALREMERIQEFAASQPGVGKVVSLVDFMKKMNKALNGDDPRFEVLPDTSELIAQYLLLYSMSGDPGDFDRVVDFGYQRSVITIYYRYDTYLKIKALTDSIEGFIATHLAGSQLTYRVGGGIANMLPLTEVIIQGKIKNILQVCGVIFGVASVVFLSLLGGLLVLLPLLIAVLANLGLMGLAGIEMSVSTATITAMALGIGADYSIYFMFRIREELSRGESWARSLEISEMNSGKAILFVATSVALGYACMCASGFLVHIHLGTLVPVTMLVSSLGALTIMPAILMATKPRFLTRGSGQRKA